MADEILYAPFDIKLPLGDYATAAWESGSLNVAFPQLDVRRYGAVGDETADDAPAINAAIAAAVARGGGRVYMPPGTYRVDSPIDFRSTSATLTRSIELVGAPFGATVVRPSASFSGARVLDINIRGGNSSGLTRGRVSGVHLLGDLVTNTIGIGIGTDVGAAVMTGHFVLDDVQAYRFTGASGLGLFLQNVVGLRARSCEFTRNTRNVLIDTVNTDQPTWMTFDTCYFYLSVADSVVVKQGYDITFLNCTNEHNAGKGYAIIPAAGQLVVDCVIHGGWLEGNGDDFIYADGTGATAIVKVRDVNIHGGVGDVGVYFKNIANLVIDAPGLLNPSPAGFITIDTGCSGAVSNWPHGTANIRTVLVNNSPATVTVLEAASQGRLIWDIADADKPILAPAFAPPSSGKGVNLGTSALRFGQMFGSQFHGNIYQPTWGASITPDATISICQILASSNITWTLNVPTGGVFGTRIQITIRNSSGGAMGAATIAAGYKQTGYANPPNGSETSATFYYDTTAWRQVSPWVTTSV